MSEAVSTTWTVPLSLPAAHQPTMLSISLEIGSPGERNYLRSTMPLDLPMHDARLLVLRLIEQVQQAQETTERQETR